MSMSEIIQIPHLQAPFQHTASVLPPFPVPSLCEERKAWHPATREDFCQLHIFILSNEPFTAGYQYAFAPVKQ